MSNSFVPSVNFSVVNALQEAAGVDSALNVYARDVIGNKTDAEIAAVAADVGLMAYMKAQVQELDQRTVPKFRYSESNRVDYGNVLTVNAKGVLTGISVQQVPTQRGYIRIIIDGVTIYAGVIAYLSLPTEAWHSLNFNHRFDTSLVIDNYTQNAGYNRIWVAYTEETT